MSEFFAVLSHPETWDALLSSFGFLAYPLLFAIIFAETGLLMGFFLPGDSLLFVTGFVASTGHLNLWALIVSLTVAAIVGDATGFYLGKRLGRKMYDKPDSFFFKKAHLRQTEAFYEKHGGKTIILARFAPIIRTFAPFVAGMAQMHYPRFVWFNIVGGVGWISSMLVAGFYFGAIPWVKSNFEKVVLGIIFVSLLPFFIQGIRHLMRPRPQLFDKRIT